MSNTDHQDEPLQLIKFVEDENDRDKRKVELNEKTLSTMVTKAGNYPLCIICICGPSRQGKSLMLGYIIRCLECLENNETEWMDRDNKTEALTGFKFKTGTEAITKGIWIWSRPFILKNDDDEEVAVFLMDTQGTNDEFAGTRGMSVIVGLSLLTSSVMIFNFFTNLQEDILGALNGYMQYGQLALENVTGPPFQKLVFLIRDWNFPGTQAFGIKGGKLFLEEKLQIKPDQSVEARQVREMIKSCFEDTSCCLMPHIGENGLLPGFTGSISEVSSKFADNMEKFVNYLASPENLIIKTILGNPVKGPEFASYVEGYVQEFNSNDILDAANMFEATSDIFNSSVVKKAFQKYKDVAKKRMQGSKYLPLKQLERCLDTAGKQAMDLFDKARKLGSQEKITRYGEQLKELISKEEKEITGKNETRRENYLAKARDDSITQYRELLEDAIPFSDQYPTIFYEDAVINGADTRARATVLQDFREKLENEMEDIIDFKEELLKEIMESVLLSHQNQNKIQRAQAEKEITTLVTEYAVEFEEKITLFLQDNEFAEDEELTALHEKCAATALEQFKEKKKPGRKEFQGRYQALLEEQLNNLFSTMENQHKLNLQNSQKQAETRVFQLCTDYAAELEGKIYTVTEEELAQTHETRSKQILSNFELHDIPYPDGHSLRNKFLDRVKTQLNAIFIRVCHELTEYRQQCEESYNKALDESETYYMSELNGVVNSAEFLAENDLQIEHDRALETALDMYDHADRVGFLEHLLDFKERLKDGILQNFEKLKEANAKKREHAELRAVKDVYQSIREYEKELELKMVSIQTTEQLEALHQHLLNHTLDDFRKKCPAQDNPDFVGQYVEQLREAIKGTFEQTKDNFVMRKNEENVAVKELLNDCCNSYQREMDTHCRNKSFLRPDHLTRFHEQACAAVLFNINAISGELKESQTRDLQTAMDRLYLKYKEGNDMKLNDLEGPPAIGIDLGTTYSCVAVFHNGKILYIPNRDEGNSLTTPSFVRYNTNGEKTFGDTAKEEAANFPYTTIFDAKRLIGKRIEDEKLQKYLDYWPFIVKEDEGIAKIQINDTLYFPEQVSAEFLKKLKEMAERFLGLEPNSLTKAVITVPAYFNDGQRSATKDAGELAGFDVLTILNEPTAAAIAYSRERFDSDTKKVLIFDLGGGTFDVAVVDLAPGSIDVLGVRGDTDLGGVNFDKKLMEYCVLMFKADEGIDLMEGRDSTEDNVRFDARRRIRRMLNACEKAKKILSSGRTTTVRVDAIYEGIDLNVEITRKKFEELNRPKFQEAIDIMDKALADLELEKSDIVDVVLVGGSTRIPLVQKMLTEYFDNKALNFSIDPDKAVAHGAAVMAARMNGQQAQGGVDFTTIQDVTPFPLGIEVVSEKLSVIIPKNTKVPTRMKEVYTTCYDNQVSANIVIYQGEKEIAEENELLGKFLFENIPPGIKGKELLDVFLEVDSMGILHVEAICRSTMGKKKITIKEDRHRLDQETKQKLLDAANRSS